MNTALPVSDFRRLYRELCKDGDGVKREDMTYQKEREEAFYRIGHDISGIADKVAPGKHHGVVARTRTVINPEEKLKKDMELRKKHMEVQQAIRKNDEFNRMITEMRDGKGTFDDVFLDKLSKAQGMKVVRRVSSKNKKQIKGMSGTGTSALMQKTAATRRTSQPHKSSRKPSGTSAMDQVDAMMAAASLATRGDEEGPHHTFLPRHYNTRRKEQAVDKNYTTSGWSKAERACMNDIYWKLDRPRADKFQKGPWRSYYEDFASRFLVVYPKRSRDEVVKKVESLITARAFKERGEDAFWQEHKEGKTSTLVTKGTNLPQGARFPKEAGL